MKSCLECKYTEETLLDNYKKCINAKSVYYGKMVSERDLCREGKKTKKEVKNLEL